MLKYSIESTGNDYKLIVWEPAPTTINRVRPFLFKFTCSVASEREALEILSRMQACKVVRYQPKVVEFPLPSVVDESTVETKESTVNTATA